MPLRRDDFDYSDLISWRRLLKEIRMDGYHTRVLIVFVILAWAVFEKGASGWWFLLLLLFA